ncbi:hypothetical protein NEOLEDRAFT_1180204 [Neolentinus lepideus HHB14362 ss-1]|uniref:F-box domain-containing protein n=1 Tax=Neolentinus lepideus HHB14362 ss-1 TaxID=1314782 RepID=A0A165R5K7_9AGAM|nr:hypothetical protein NEOLEDRAFT_1180204 [Neolentinus lepideus HHB14362 ss-1]
MAFKYFLGALSIASYVVELLLEQSETSGVLTSAETIPTSSPNPVPALVGRLLLRRLESIAHKMFCRGSPPIKCGDYGSLELTFKINLIVHPSRLQLTVLSLVTIKWCPTVPELMNILRQMKNLKILALGIHIEGCDWVDHLDWLGLFSEETLEYIAVKITPCHYIEYKLDVLKDIINYMNGNNALLAWKVYTQATGTIHCMLTPDTHRMMCLTHSKGVQLFFEGFTQEEEDLVLNALRLYVAPYTPDIKHLAIHDGRDDTRQVTLDWE